MPIAADQRIPAIKQVLSSQESPNKVNQRWWNVPKDELYAHVFSVCDGIMLNLTTRRRMNYFFSILYNDVGAAFSASKNINLYYNQVAIDSNSFPNSRMTLNVLQNCIDTAASMISKNKPKPQFLTDGEKDYNTRQKGKKLTNYIAGVFDEMKLYTKAQRMFIDACVYGTGAMKLFIYDGKIHCERVFIEEILVDDLEGTDQTPRQIHQRKYIQREVLIDQFPDYEQEILDASQVAGGMATFSTADIIPVIESWHLPSGPKAKDGCHTISIESCTLLKEEYKKDYFPIIFFRWADQSIGFWGRGICHELWKMQLELDILYRMIQQAMRLVGGPVIGVEAGSNIQENHITNNRLAKIIEFSEKAPQYMTPPIMQAEVYEHIDRIEDRMYKVCGVSQANATGTKPPEVKSGAAIREVADIAQGRFELIGQRWEELFLAFARVAVDLSADLYKDNKELSVIAKYKKGVGRINFKDVATALEDFELQLFPISGLSATPAGRLDQLSEYADRGYISKEQLMDITDFPDLEATVSVETASLHLTQQIISNIKEKGEAGYKAPNPFLNLQQSFQLACLEVDNAELENVPEEHVDILRRWANACKDLLDQSNGQVMAPPPQPQQPQQQLGQTPQGQPPQQ